METQTYASVNVRHSDEASRLHGIASQALYLVLSATVLIASLALLAITLASDLHGPPLIAVVIWEGIGFIVGLYSSVRNLRAALSGRAGGLLIGVDERMDVLPSRALVDLARRADGDYDARAREFKACILSPAGRHRRLKETVLAVSLAATVAVASYLLPHSSWGEVGTWALLALFAPYLVAVLYQFFCGTLDRYAFRCDSMRMALAGLSAYGHVADMASKSPSRIGDSWFSGIRASWVRATLRFPVVAAFLALVLGRGVWVALGLLVSQAVLPLLDVKLASTSLVDFVPQGCALFGWVWGFEQSLRLLSFVGQWDLPHTLGAILTLATTSYMLGFASVPNQVRRYGPRSLAVIVISAVISPVAWLGVFIYPFVWLLSLGLLRSAHLGEVVVGSLSRFWVGMFHLGIIYAAFAVLLNYGDRLIALVR